MQAKRYKTRPSYVTLAAMQVPVATQNEHGLAFTRSGKAMGGLSA